MERVIWMLNSFGRMIIEESESGVMTFGAGPAAEASDDMSLLTLSVSSGSEPYDHEPLIMPSR